MRKKSKTFFGYFFLYSQSQQGKCLKNKKWKIYFFFVNRRNIQFQLEETKIRSNFLSNRFIYLDDVLVAREKKINRKIPHSQCRSKEEKLSRRNWKKIGVKLNVNRNFKIEKVFFAATLSKCSEKTCCQYEKNALLSQY